MSAYLKAMRSPFLAGSIVPVLLGAAYAFTYKAFIFSYFLITVLGVAALHLAANILNDYYDARGSDAINVRLTPFSGGSRVIQEKGLAPGLMLAFALVLFAVGMASGIWLVILGRPLVLVIGLLGLAAGWTYSAPPFQLMARGWGEIVIFFAFGPLVTLGTYYVMTGALDWPAFALGFPQGFLIMGVIWINQFPDYEADLEAGKRNLVVRWGREVSRVLYCVIMLMSFCSILFLAGAVGLPIFIVIAFAAFPLAYKAMRILWREYLSHERVVPAQALTIQTLIVQGLLICVGLVLGRFFSA
jgi:1,4-dihydroxy-2-naphthoate octaprenyltransferase